MGWLSVFLISHFQKLISGAEHYVIVDMDPLERRAYFSAWIGIILISSTVILPRIGYIRRDRNLYPRSRSWVWDGHLTGYFCLDLPLCEVE